MKILKEFESFIMRGNVIDLAVAVVIGTAFGKIVSSFVNDILMPPIGLLLGGVNFSDMSFVLKQATDSSAAVVLGYGAFVQSMVDFLIISASVFAVLKFVNVFIAKKQETKTPEPTGEEKILMEIRDILKEK
ncbi:MAG: large-conductance mechanosensitive channel protein MscL [Candidatus Pacebacteria bacterium]|nr:large-conductance mechanosensitive channel protein MscL [Candidatus Paceibacterota bacterium]